MLDKNFEEIEKHLDYSASYLKDAIHEAEVTISDLNDVIQRLEEEKELLEEQNILLEEEINNLTIDKAKLHANIYVLEMDLVEAVSKQKIE